MCINKSNSNNAKKTAGLISSPFTFYIVQFRLDPSKILSPRHGNIFIWDKASSNHFEGVVELQNFSSQENHPKGCSLAQPPASIPQHSWKRVTGTITASCSKMVKAQLGRDTSSNPSFFPITTYYRGKAVKDFGRHKQVFGHTPSQLKKGLQDSKLPSIFHPTRFLGN